MISDPRTAEPDGARDLVSHAYEQLKHLIVLGRLSPGSRIIESDLANRLGVSRTPIRSALGRLQQEGFVVAADGGKNAKLAVAPLTEEDGRELINLLGALEGLAARWAAARPKQERRELARELTSLNDHLQEIMEEEGRDPEDIFDTHSRFHTLHVEAVGSPRVRTMHARIWPQAERYRRVYITGPPQGFHAEVEEHKKIISAIERGDPEGAQLAVQANWEHTAERLHALIRRHGSRGAW